MPLRGRPADRYLLRRVGRPAIWEKGLLCPYLAENGQHPTFCPYCSGGRGYQYVDAQKIYVLFTSDHRDNPFDMAGAWERGECGATIAAHCEVADQDRLVPQDDPVTYDMVIERGGSSIDGLRVPNVDELLYVRGVSVGYTVGTDCKLSQAQSGDYQVEWLGAREPIAGQKYTVRLRVRPTWIVQGPPMVRALGPGKSRQLPLRVSLKRFDKAVAREG